MADASATTNGGTPAPAADAAPPAPTQPTANACGPGAVLIKWSGRQEDDSYEVLAKPTSTLHTTDGILRTGDYVNRGLLLSGLESDAQYSFEIRAVAAGRRSDAAVTAAVTVTAAKPRAGWWIASWLLVIVLGGLAIGFQLSSLTPTATVESLVFAFAVMAGIAALLTAIGGRFGVFRMVIGGDQRVSTSQVQTALWTALVAFILAYFTARSWIYHEPCLFDALKPAQDSDKVATAHGCLAAGSQLTSAWDDYLILLGGPFAAFVAARAVVTAKIQNQTIQKTLPDDGSTSVLDAVRDDDGNLDIVDSQYLIFNAIALAYVIVGLAQTNRLPAIPGLLMALTSSSAATYVLNKTTQNSAPTIGGVTPSAARPGDTIVITGTNLTPPGSTTPPLVSIGGQTAIVVADGAKGRVSAIVPPGVAPGMKDVVVTTSARISTDGRPIQVLPDQPVILDVTPKAAVPRGATVRIDGQGFISGLDAVHYVDVRFGDSVAKATPVALPTGLERIEVRVPPEAPTGADVHVTVTTPRFTHTETTLHIVAAAPRSSGRGAN